MIVFKELNFEFTKGQVYILKGENGSGKTTLLKILQRFISPTEGEVEINGRKYNTLVGTDIRNYIGVYSSDFRLFAGSLENNMKFRLFDNAENVSIGIDEFIGLPRTYQISSNGKNLSQGQQQKTLLKRALYEDKAVYLFDEPTSNLDLISKKRFVNLVLDLQSRGKIVCIITHDPELMGISTQILNLSEKA